MTHKTRQLVTFTDSHTQSYTKYDRALKLDVAVHCVPQTADDAVRAQNHRYRPTTSHNPIISLSLSANPKLDPQLQHGAAKYTQEILVRR